jgi:riboflavin synthase
VSPNGPCNAKANTTAITTGTHARSAATVGTMFTGIVEEMGRVIEISPVQTDWGQGMSLKISAAVVLEGSGLGASISVNGCCLTLVEQGVDAQGAGWWTTHVSQETLDRTVIGDLVAGSPVNLERPMQLGDRLGGHIVLGHVDGTGEIISPAPDLRVRAPQEMMKYLVEKGSVTVDGISLTAFGLTEDSFQVAVIPHTAEVTTLGTKGAGDRVNLEFDVLAKHIERLMPPSGPS